MKKKTQQNIYKTKTTKKQQRQITQTRKNIKKRQHTHIQNLKKKKT